jgi:Aspartyl protease
MINADVAIRLGYNPDASRDRVRLTTANDVESAPRVMFESVEALGELRRNFPLVCHTLPSSTGVEGLLGLDFMRGQRLVIDFRRGIIELD